jgi:peptide/nickel transport system ATP-binding protein
VAEFIQEGPVLGGPAEAGLSPVLEVRDLNVRFRTRAGTVQAVNGLSLQVAPGEVLSIVGESGSGKSVSMYSVMGLVKDRNATITGSARFQGRDILGLDDAAMAGIRGRQIAMIFQDPMTSLTPVYTIGWQIAEQLRAHGDFTKREARERAVELLDEVGIPDPRRRVDNYPHEFSGGMRQRAMIAMALSCNPGLLIADEPTTALDVTIQAQILDLMRRLREKHGSSIVLITHNMGVVSELADRVIVMYAGRVVESGPRREVIRRARHPYTWGLLDAVPRIGDARRRLTTIPGSPASPLAMPGGCPFEPRCVYRFDACSQPPPLSGTGDHLDACWLPAEDRAAQRRRAATVAEGSQE